MRNTLWFFGDDITVKRLILQINDKKGIIFGVKRGYGFPNEKSPEDAGMLRIIPEEEFSSIEIPGTLGFGWEKADLNKLKSKLKSVDSTGARAIIQNYIFG